MGMPRFLVDMILDLKACGTEFGDVLSVARQTVHITEDEFLAGRRRYGIND